MPRIKHRRGLKSALPTSLLETGELLLTTDKNTIHFADSATTTKTLVPAIDDLVTLASVDGAADLVMIYDGSETGVQAKKMTFAAFKSALSIPEGSADEKVAVVSGGTAGYIWGSDGTDGVFRLNSSLSWTKDAGNGFVTLAVDVVDCGTF